MKPSFVIPSDFIPLTSMDQPAMSWSGEPSDKGQERPQSAPRVPQGHLFQADRDFHFLVANGSRIYSVPRDVAREIEAAMGEPSLSRSKTPGELRKVDDLLASLGLHAPAYITDEPPASPPVRSLSLAIAQKCNLGCTYCYAREGTFGNAPKQMTLETALAAVDLLVREAEAGGRINIAFLGGEPLANRSVLRETTERAAQLAAQKRVRVAFSITTNGTLLTPDDADFFERYGFAVTVSLDGVGATHDELRPFKSGKGSYDSIISRVEPLLAMQRDMQVSARVTVTPSNISLRETLDEFVDLGFHSVGFSPMLSSPTHRGEMNGAQLDALLRQMVECGEQFESEVVAGKRYPFLNMVNALAEIHKGTHRPYSCGAGAGYFGVSADGELYACHRFVGDEAGALGNLADGVNRTRQKQWLTERHVHHQEPCRSCWARYLCGGGCHHEVINRGRPACHYIRGWLHYCLQAYARLSEKCPDYFGLAP